MIFTDLTAENVDFPFDPVLPAGWILRRSTFDAFRWGS